MQQTGHITYFYKTSLGWRQPEMQYTYDLALPSDEIQLRPEDGEAESFELLDVPNVLQRMHKGEFKANCCLGRSDCALTCSFGRLFHSAWVPHRRERATLRRDRHDAAHRSVSSHAIGCIHTMVNHFTVIQHFFG